MKNKIIILIFTAFIFSCNLKSDTALNSEDTSFDQAEFSADSEKPSQHNLTLIAAGDNLFHITIINRANEDGKYNFTPIYSEIKDLVENADIAFINQETVMAGESYGYSGFPKFNTPQSLARTLSDTGFNIINLANNHAMDMGKDGLYATLDLLETMEEITVIGARKTDNSHQIITKNNITLGFLSYAHSLNGNPLPDDNPNLVSMINRNKMTQEIKALRPLCDFLVVSMHWGDEYHLAEPGSDQKSLAIFLAEQNVDLIIGHHPHVLQRVEKLKRPDGKETLCFYSLGNFVSNQNRKERILGGIMLVTFEKEDDALSIKNSGLIPVICHFEAGYINTKIYPIYKYTEELLKKHSLYSSEGDMDFDFFHSVLRKLETKIIMHNPF